MTASLGVLLVSETEDKTQILQTMLTESGFRLNAHISLSDDILEAVNVHEPDVVLVNTESTNRYFMNQLYNLNQENPKPIVIFTEKSESGLIDAAITAGVSAYVVDGLSSKRVKPVIEIARARFLKDQAIHSELTKTKSKLEERKTIERAKGIIMKSRRLTEDDAYKELRKLAMNRNKRLIDIATDVISASELLM